MIKRNGIIGKWVIKAAFFAVLILIFQGLVTGGGKKGDSVMTHSLRESMLQELIRMLELGLYDMYVPCISFVEESAYKTNWILQEQMDGLFPFYGYVVRSMRAGEREDNLSLRDMLLAEAEEGSVEMLPEERELQQEQQQQQEQVHSLAELLRAENEAAQQMRIQESVLSFVPHEMQTQVDLAALQNYETLLTQFYTVDANTMAGSDQLNVERFLQKDMSIKKEGQKPQILIFHTHSQEGFADSVPGDASTSIVGAGERLTRILTDTYGYNVLHHTAGYDVETRDDAYSKALPEVEQILKENPSIEVVIDLHRDSMPEGTKLVMDLDGRPTARFMFFNGLSRTRKTGNIAYLYNENLEDNLAFSFQMQLAAAQYYPGLTRKIYLKGYRYNMHLKDKYLLVELGAQNNTVEEIMNACDPLAHVLDLVLSGGSGE